MASVPPSNSRWIALVGLFSALYIVTAALASYISRLGYPEHFLRGIIMTALVIQARKKWSATTMGIVCGIIFALSVAAPAPYLLPSTVASGLFFDLVLIASGYFSQAVQSTRKLILAAGLSGIAESVVALAILTIYSPGTLGSTTNLIEVAWALDLVLNVILSIIGALVAIRFLSKQLNLRAPRSQT